MSAAALHAVRGARLRGWAAQILAAAKIAPHLYRLYPDHLSPSVRLQDGERLIEVYRAGSPGCEVEAEISITDFLLVPGQMGQAGHTRTIAGMTDEDLAYVTSKLDLLMLAAHAATKDGTS